MHVGSANAATIPLDEHSAEDLVRDHDVTGVIIDNDDSGSPAVNGDAADETTSSADGIAGFRWVIVTLMCKKYDAVEDTSLSCDEHAPMKGAT